MFGRELVVVDAIDKGAVDILFPRSRDDHLPGATGDMRAGLGLGGEQAGALQDDVDAQCAPRQLGRITLGEHPDPVTLDHKVATFDGNFVRELPVRRVVLGQMRVRFGIAQIVHGDDLDLARAIGLVQRAQHIAADAAVAVDGNLDGHWNS